MLVEHDTEVEGLGIVMAPFGACRRELERGELV
jgi:hypothetical protein